MGSQYVYFFIGMNNDIPVWIIGRSHTGYDKHNNIDTSSINNSLAAHRIAHLAHRHFICAINSSYLVGNEKGRYIATRKINGVSVCIKKYIAMSMNSGTPVLIKS